MPHRFVSVHVLAPNREVGGRLVAEAFEAGTSGVEELVEGREMVLYAPERQAALLLAAIAPFRAEGVQLAEPVPVPRRDWSRAWQAGLGPIEISSRLVIHPSFLPAPRGADRARIVIDPGQAFGTGSHASTRLALGLLDALDESRRAGARVLDVGCGTGILALAALRLGAASAVALDTDPLAAAAARDNATANRLGGALRVFVGGLEALAADGFDLVLANLLRSEVEPLLPSLARVLAPGGTLILSGWLAAERERAHRGLVAAGLVPRGERQLAEPEGDAWLGLEAVLAVR